MAKIKKSFLAKIIILLLSIFFLSLAKKNIWAQQRKYEGVVSDESEYTAEHKDKDTYTNLLYNLNISVSGPVSEQLAQAEGRGGAIAKIGGLIAYVVAKPPVSSREYLADLGSSLGLPIKSAYAQGVGWKALEPILPVWKGFRNLTYLAFVIIFVVIGFMIMFRAKINPQTVISIQAALPKIVITLLLVTFSYAIAGLMIDLIYIIIYLLVGAAQLAGLIENSDPALNNLLYKNPFGLVFDTSGGRDIFIQGPGDAIQNLINGFFGDWFDNTGFANVIGGLAKLIIGVAILISLFKLFFSLLLSYLGIIFSVIFSPFSILFNAFPGSNAFMGWLKNLFANIIVFPAIAGMFLIAAILIGPKNNAPCGDKNNTWCVEQGIGYYNQAENGTEVWVPPLLNIGSHGGGGDANTFQGLIALGIIMFMPQVAAKIKKMLKVEPSGLGAAVVGGIMTGPQAIGGVLKTGYGGVQQISNFKFQRKQKKYWDKQMEKQG